MSEKKVLPSTCQLFNLSSCHLAGQHKLRGFLATSLHLELFSLRAYFKVLRQKVPYFNVSRQKIPYFNVSRRKVPYFYICDVFNWCETLSLSLHFLPFSLSSSTFSARRAHVPTICATLSAYAHHPT